MKFAALFESFKKGGNESVRVSILSSIARALSGNVLFDFIEEC